MSYRTGFGSLPFSLSSHVFSRLTIPAILAIMLLSGSAWSQTFDDAKAKFDAGDFVGAATEFEEITTAGVVNDRAKAASFVIRSWSKAGRHDQVLRQYETCLAAARGTEFEAECVFERAKSTELNAKDITLALQQYDDVLENYSSNVFAASGALLQRGTIELDKLKTPSASYSTFDELIRQYPSSPFVDNALVAEARNGVALAQLDIIEAAQRQLEAMGASPTMLQKVQLEQGEYFARVVRDRYAAVQEYRKVFTIFPSDTNAAVMAKIRAADFVPAGDFAAAIGLYDAVLNRPGKLSADVRHWALCQKGIYEFQLNDPDTALQTFRDLLEIVPPGKIRRTATQYVTGITESDTTASVIIHYDRGIRWKQTDMRLDRTFWDMQRVIVKSGKPFFRAYIDDVSVDKEERAQMLYRVCFARFWCGQGKLSYDLAGEILEQQQPEGVTRHQCEYMRAYLLGRASRWSEAVAAWRSLIEENPKTDILADAYLEYSRALDFSGDKLGAVLALEELLVRFPASLQAQYAVGLRKQHFAVNTSLIAQADKQRPLIAQKWKRPPGSVIVDTDDDSAPVATFRAGGGGQ